MRYINFCYRYRDAGNNKKHGTVSFINTVEINLEELDRVIRSKLIDDIWFVAAEWGLPDLHFECWDWELDHDWHEYIEVEESDELFGVGYELKDLINLLKYM